ncbi:hypothetical protein HAX54_028527, partial [Datura stramonium]|nr:hypothetical protein [Datura stramonium]
TGCREWLSPENTPTGLGISQRRHTKSEQTRVVSQGLEPQYYSITPRPSVIIICLWEYDVRKDQIMAVRAISSSTRLRQ